MQSAPVDDILLKETKPNIGRRKVSGNNKHTSSFVLVEEAEYLYVRVFKAADLPGRDVNGTYDYIVEVKVGFIKLATSRSKNPYPQWLQVFAFTRDHLQSSVVVVTVYDGNDFKGQVMFDLDTVPKRVPPEDPLAPQWYSLEDRKSEKVEGELMLAVWKGTQADEAFSEARLSEELGVSGTDALANVRSKVYLSPRLSYLRVNVFEALGLQPRDKSRPPEVFVVAYLGNQVLKTRISESRTVNPFWNEDLIFVAVEPFEEPLILNVQDRVAPNKDELLGRCAICFNNMDWRLDYSSPVNSSWHFLEKQGDLKPNEETKIPSRIHVRICLEGGYHVMDESTNYCSDFRPTAKELWQPRIGILELGILSAKTLLPMKTKDGQGRTNAYCVVKYGRKWVRTRTIIDNLHPKWNEQYTWEVSDPCTVITIGVFDNCQLHGGDKCGGAKDIRIGKVRIRLSTLESDRVYTHSYPLLVLHPDGVKKMGEIHLALRFTCTSLLRMMHVYSQPLLPNMHHLHPISDKQLDTLKHWATQILSMKLSMVEPPLRKEVVEYMLDVEPQTWSLRSSKANFFRVVGVLSGLTSLGKWFVEVCNWKSPRTTILIHILYIIVVIYELILPTIFLCPFLIGAWYYRRRPRYPPHIDVRLSYADSVGPDELDEEFDTLPTSRPSDLVRARYDRLRIVAMRIQTVASEVASQGERLQYLVLWRDPRATVLFMIFQLVAAIVVYVTPFKVLAILTGFYELRHPRFRSRLPSVPLNFFRRLPTKTDCTL